MKKQYKTLDQLKDSTLLFEQDMPQFGYMLIMIIVLTVAGILFWASNAHKPYIIKTQGTITGKEATYVMPVYTGEIESSFLEEGKLVQEGETLFTIKSTDYNLQEEQLKATKETYEKQVEKYQLLVKSIQDDTNYFSSTEANDTYYYSTYETYKSQIAQNTFDGSTYAAYGYTDEQIANEASKNSEKNAEIYYSAINSAESSIKEAQTQIDSIDAQLSAIEIGQAEYTVTAAASGIVHLLADYKEGMVVQTGTAVATITPEKSNAIVHAYVSTADIPRIREGNKVQIAVDGLSQTLYGTISGKLVQIDRNVTTLNTENSNKDSNAVFKIIVKPDSTYLVNKSGNKIDISNGMTTELRITYDEITYMDYVLEKLGLLVR